MDIHPHDPRWILDDELFAQLEAKNDLAFLLDLLSAWYVYSVENHGEQFSDLYKVSCAILSRGFKPGLAIERGELDGSAQEIYDSIVVFDGFDYK